MFSIAWVVEKLLIDEWAKPECVQYFSYNSKDLYLTKNTGTLMGFVGIKRRNQQLKFLNKPVDSQ